AIVPAVRHGRHRDPLHPRQGWTDLEIVQVLGDRRAVALDADLDPAVLEVESVAGQTQVASPPQCEGAVADALDAALHHDLRRGPGGGHVASLRARVGRSAAPAGGAGAGWRNGRGDWI